MNAGIRLLMFRSQELIFQSHNGLPVGVYRDSLNEPMQKWAGRSEEVWPLQAFGSDLVEINGDGFGRASPFPRSGLSWHRSSSTR